MRLPPSLLATASAFALMAGPASAAGAPSIVQAGVAGNPERSYVLTLPGARLLSPSQVRVTENGVPVAGLRVERVGESSRSRTAAVVAIDASWSMAGRSMDAAMAAARAFAAARNPGEEFALVTFSNTLDVVEPLTTKASAISSALAATPRVHVGTRIYDALQQILSLINAAHVNAGSIVILTDGSDVGGVSKPSAVLQQLARAHVRVFSVGIPSPTYDAKALEQMASATGGAYVEASSAAKLRPILARLSQRLSSEYLLSYRSRVNPGARVSVAVSIQGVAGVAKAAYVSPKLHLIPAPPVGTSTSTRLIESPVVMALVVVAIVALLLYALANLLWRREDPLLARVGSYVSVGDQPQATQPADDDQPGRGPSALATRMLRGIRSSFDRHSWSGRLSGGLEMADIDMSVARFLFIAAVITVLVAAVLDFLMGPVLAVLVAAIAVPVGARMLALRRLGRKRRIFAEQLPDSLDVLVSALRAGHSLVGALTVVADDAAEPSKSEYHRVLADEQLGMNLEDALQLAARRMDNDDLEQVSLVARLQREMGSNAADVLEHVIATVRGRTELRRLVRTLTAQGRLARWILTGLPLGLLLAFTLINPGYMHPLYHKAVGHELLLGAAVLVCMGSVIIGKIVDIER